MMCLGWDNNPICKPPDVVDITPPVQSAAAQPCPSVLWFWLASAAVAVGAVMKRGRR